MFYITLPLTLSRYTEIYRNLQYTEEKWLQIIDIDIGFTFIQ